VHAVKVAAQNEGDFDEILPVLRNYGHGLAISEFD
jgi:hypothetical protein